MAAILRAERRKAVDRGADDADAQGDLQEGGEDLEDVRSCLPQIGQDPEGDMSAFHQPTKLAANVSLDNDLLPRTHRILTRPLS